VAYGIDYVVSANIISKSELFLLSEVPEVSFFQPALMIKGFSINHSNAFGMTELNYFHISTQFNIKNELFACNLISVENSIFFDRIYSLSYAKRLNSLTIGTSGKIYHYKVNDYSSLIAGTINFGTVYDNNNIKSSVSITNVSRTSSNNYIIPSVYKLEFAVKSWEKVNCGFSVEKEQYYDYRYAFGSLQKISDYLNISLGVINNPNQFSAGCEIIINNMNINYGAKTHFELGLTHAIGIVVYY
jgi:hypothetical protein